jgi:hypothetical protein
MALLSGAIGILKQPRSRIAETGTYVEFGVIATNLVGSEPLSYQWKINGIDIAGATNDVYSIAGVDFANIATYTVEITAATNSALSDAAHLAIYHLMQTNSTIGTLGVPIGWFTNTISSGTCATNFTKAYNPVLDTGLPAFFYGKYVSSQTGPFQNTAYSKLTIDTFHCDNDPADTGLMLQRNWMMNPPVMCSDVTNAAPACHLLGAKGGPITLSTASNAKYRLTLMHKATPPSSGKVYFNWLYE